MGGLTFKDIDCKMSPAAYDAGPGERSNHWADVQKFLTP